MKQFPNSEDANLPTITATNALFNIEKIRSDSLVISIKDHGLKFKIVAPFQNFNSIHVKSVSDNVVVEFSMKTKFMIFFQITSLDVSSGGIGISAGDDGMFVWEAQNGLVRVSYEIQICIRFLSLFFTFLEKT